MHIDIYDCEWHRLRPVLVGLNFTPETIAVHNSDEPITSATVQVRINSDYLLVSADFFAILCIHLAKVNIGKTIFICVSVVPIVKSKHAHRKTSNLNQENLLNLQIYPERNWHRQYSR